jgi:hypothetical protein
VKEVLDRVKLRFVPSACDAVAITVKSPFWDVVDEEASPQKEDAFKGLLWRRSDSRVRWFVVALDIRYMTRIAMTAKTARFHMMAAVAFEALDSRVPASGMKTLAGYLLKRYMAREAPIRPRKMTAAPVSRPLRKRMRTMKDEVIIGIPDSRPLYPAAMLKAFAAQRTPAGTMISQTLKDLSNLSKSFGPKQSAIADCSRMP